MSPATQSELSQPVENTSRVPGRVRVKPRQLSPLLKQIIVERFRAVHSSEDIAEELRIPARTVSDVLLVEALRRAPEPYRPLALRRTA